MAVNQGQIFHRGTVQFTAAESIAANLLVTRTTAADTVGLCGSAGSPIAINATGSTIPSGAVGEFQLLTVGDRVLGVSNGTITVADFVKAAASGQVAPAAGVTTRHADTFGQADSTISGSGNFFFWVTA